MSARLLLASPLGFLIGVSLGALGGGGSILAVPVLVFVAGQTPTEATSTSLVVVGVASLIGAYGHWRSGRVRVTTGIAFGLVGIVGSFAGSALNRRLDGDVLLLAFSGLILVAAWRIVAGCPSCTRHGEAQAIGDLTATDGRRRAHGAVSTLAAPPRTAARIAEIGLAGTGVGFLTGLFGVGGGFVIVPALALVLAFPMPQAVGTSLLVITVNTAVALAARAGTGTIDWGATVLFTVVATVGVGAGTRLADRIEPETMQRSFAVLLVAVAVYTGARAVVALL
jgi:hypothetical protein